MRQEQREVQSFPKKETISFTIHSLSPPFADINLLPGLFPNQVRVGFFNHFPTYAPVSFLKKFIKEREKQKWIS